MVLPTINSTLNEESPSNKLLTTRPQQQQTKSMIDLFFQPKKKPYQPPPFYHDVRASDNLGSSLSTESLEHKVKHRPFQSNVSFDTVNIGVSPSEGVDPKENPEYYGLDSNSLFLSFGTKKVGAEEPQFTRFQIASMSQSEYEKFLKDQKTKQENTMAMHNQVCCFSKQHRDFNTLYHNLHNRNRKKDDKLPVYPRRVILVYISGRRHTWVALDWVLKKLLVNGDHLVVVCSLFPEALDKIGNKDFSTTSVDSRTNRFSTNRVSSRSRSRLALRGSPSPMTREDDRGDSRFYDGYGSYLDIRKKARSIMRYILAVSDSDLVVKITIDLSIGGTKDVLKDSYILYTPTLVVCAAKPRKDSAPMSSWKGSRLTDRVVKNFTIPVIIVPALNMEKFEKQLFEELSLKLFSKSDPKVPSTTGARLRASVSEPKLTANFRQEAKTKDFLSPNESNQDANDEDDRFSAVSSSTTSSYSTNSDSDSDSESVFKDDSATDALEELVSKRSGRPHLKRLKTLISDLNYETAPDLSTKEKIKLFVNKQEKKLTEKLDEIPMELEGSSSVANNFQGQVDPNYFKNQLELISAGSLFITKKLKALDFSDDAEGAELVRSITGDPALLRPRKFKSMLLDDDSMSPKRIPAAEINKSKKDEDQNIQRQLPKIKFADVSPQTEQKRPELESRNSAPDIRFKDLTPQKSATLTKSGSRRLLLKLQGGLFSDSDSAGSKSSGSRSRTQLPERKKSGLLGVFFRDKSSSRSKSRERSKSSDTSKGKEKKSRRWFL